jgi:cholesterol transport system auxiliary component
MGAAGCLSPGAEPLNIHTYQLTVDGWHGEARADGGSGPVLLVSIPRAEPGFETSRMVYVRRPYELDYYSMNQWADTPVRMFAPLLVQALGQGGVWRAVIPLPSSVHGDYRLDTYRFVLQQEFFQQPSRVRVMLHAQLVNLHDSRILGTRIFEAVEAASSEDAYGGVLAANRAVASLLDRLNSWLQECVGRQADCGSLNRIPPSATP